MEKAQLISNSQIWFFNNLNLLMNIVELDSPVSTLLIY